MRAPLSALLDDALRRLPLEPNLHDKRVLGAQTLELAHSLAALGGREPGGEPDRAALLALARDELTRLDPAGDEPRYRALALLVRQLERHALELPPGFIVFEAETVPARDPFVEIGPETPGPHAELNRVLIIAEAAAATAADTPLETTLLLTELAAAKLEETVAVERTLETPWGSEPVALDDYEQLMALDIDNRVKKLLREGRRGDEDAGL